MIVEIPFDCQQFVHALIDAGSYKNEAEVVGAALRLLQERRRRIEDLRREIQPALDQLDRGEGIELDDAGLDAFFEDIKARGRERWRPSKRAVTPLAADQAALAVRKSRPEIGPIV